MGEFYAGDGVRSGGDGSVPWENKIAILRNPKIRGFGDGQGLPFHPRALEQASAASGR